MKIYGDKDRSIGVAIASLKLTESTITGLVTPPPDDSTSCFDIVAHYNRLISTDQSTTPAIAAIESLIANLSASSLTTISETIDLLRTASSTLATSQTNPIPLSAGTELLQRYIVTVFQQQPAQLSGNDFTQLRRQLITNSKLFVSRTKSARLKIAKHALPFIRDDSTLFAYGSSRVVDAILTHAARQNRYFQVIFISPTSPDPTEDSATQLLSLDIPTATIPLPALSHTIASLSKRQSTNTLFLLGAEAVLENGAALSNLGSHLVASVAKSNSIPCYFAAESYKFTRQFPTAFGDVDLRAMGAKQEVLRFRHGVEEDKKELQMGGGEANGGGAALVDITPPGLISGLITENGVMTCEGVAEELIKLWF